VYELIQNADDNNYTQASATDEGPYLRFNVYPGKIVIESNEDGFCEEHVKAICSTGESTKATTQGYIGEKGIGFKSVFKIAKKVHIQSGPFSFSFEYTKDSDDDGLGMVTPLDEEYEDLPEGTNTRITLTLLNSIASRQGSEDLFKLPDTLLLFLAKLNSLEINIHSLDGSSKTSKYTHIIYDDKSEAIERRITCDGEMTEDSLDYYVFRKEIDNLPHDEARKHTNQATVVLAFPIDNEEKPIVEQQHVYAFLPLRMAGFTVCFNCFLSNTTRIFSRPNVELSSLASTKP
jgi:hypothetical protein